MIGIALPQLITQIVSFLILMGVLYIVLYKPLANMMRTRSEKIRAGLQAAEDARQEVKDAEQRVEQEIQAARQQASGIISEAQAAAQKLTEQEATRAQEQAANIIAKAEEEKQRLKDAAFEEVRQQFADLTVQATEKVLQAKIDKKANAAIIDATLEEALKKPSGSKTG